MATSLGVAVFVHTSYRDERIDGFVRSSQKISVQPEAEIDLPSSDMGLSNNEKSVAPVVSRRLSKTAESFAVFQPNADVLYPGALVRTSSLVSGTLQPVGNIGRAPSEVTITNITLLEKENQTGGDAKAAVYSSRIDNPDASSVNEAVRSMVKRVVPGTTAAKLSYQLLKTNSLEEGFTRLGISAGWLGGEVKSSLGKQVREEKSSFIIKFSQEYYTASFATPARPSDVFSRRVTSGDLEQTRGDSLGYISSVTYGRVLYVVVSSSVHEDQMRTTLDLALKQVASKQELQFSHAQREMLGSSEIRILALGGNSDQAMKVISGDLTKVRDFLESGAQFSANSPGVPISYTARYLSDNELAKVSFTTNYVVETGKARAPVTAVVRLVALDVYLDGSPGKDKWSTWVTINGKRYKVWNRKKDISDNGNITDPKGPGGDGNASRYSLENEYEVSLSPGEPLKVEFHGVAHDNDDAVDPSSRLFLPSDYWGIGQSTDTINNYPCHRMGAANGHQTEYYIWFNIRKKE
ncbi:thiol-activated cytolysin family protein [Luteolibacter yonseiensis]|uniref:Thiol-activated cytolysin family protein n=1 Tax=Luteolibacter yonseiensis TaxID=1144680 RepID=A0A934R2C3_9BACT|nr:thiol-activated cytolysin family protein [Luteolibacter yonseiensis]MBK1815162.1 thiol-activated cytolysin family protein [Luteolibacter yonseiensis]